MQLHFSLFYQEIHCFSAFSSTDLIVLSEAQNFINAYKLDYI